MISFLIIVIKTKTSWEIRHCINGILIASGPLLLLLNLRYCLCVYDFLHRRDLLHCKGKRHPLHVTHHHFIHTVILLLLLLLLLLHHLQHQHHLLLNHHRRHRHFLHHLHRQALILLLQRQNPYCVTTPTSHTGTGAEWTIDTMQPISVMNVIVNVNMNVNMFLVDMTTNTTTANNNRCWT